MNRFFGYNPVPVWAFVCAFIVSVAIFNAMQLVGLLPRSFLWWDSMAPGGLGVWALYTARSERKGSLLGCAIFAFFVVVAGLILANL